MSNAEQTDDEVMAELLETVSYGGVVGRWEDTPETGLSDDEPTGLVLSHGSSPLGEVL